MQIEVVLLNCIIAFSFTTVIIRFWVFINTHVILIHVEFEQGILLNNFLTAAVLLSKSPTHAKKKKYEEITSAVFSLKHVLCTSGHCGEVTDKSK